MKIRKKIKINNIGLGLIIALLLYANCMLTNAASMRIMLVIIMGVSFVCALLLVIDKSIIKMIFRYDFFRWNLIVWIIFVIYGVFNSYKKSYSLQYHLLSYIYIFLIMILIYHSKSRFLDVISIAFSMDIILIAVHTMILSGGNIVSLVSSGVRVGNGGAGNVNTAAITYAFLVIPLLYQFFVLKKRIYLIPGSIALIFMLLTGSKKTLGIIVVVGIVFIFSYSKNINSIVNNLIRVALVILLIILVIYFVPSFHENIWNRIGAMIQTLSSFDVRNQSSTSLRLTYIVTVLTKFWDKPFLGHGWGAFAQQYGYSSLYQTNLYSHCNYTEVLFSFGIIGFLLFYYFPIKLLKKTNTLSFDSRLFARLYLCVFLFIDIGTVTCYDTIIGYISYLMVDYIVHNDKSWKGSIE